MEKENPPLTIRIVARHSAREDPTEQALLLRPPLEHKSHVSIPYSTQIAVADLIDHGIGIQGVGRDEILHDGQRGRVDAKGHTVVVRVLSEYFDEGDVGVMGIANGYARFYG